MGSEMIPGEYVIQILVTDLLANRKRMLRRSGSTSMSSTRGSIEAQTLKIAYQVFHKLGTGCVAEPLKLSVGGP